MVVVGTSELFILQLLLRMNLKEEINLYIVNPVIEHDLKDYTIVGKAGDILPGYLM